MSQGILMPRPLHILKASTISPQGSLNYPITIRYERGSNLYGGRAALTSSSTSSHPLSRKQKLKLACPLRRKSKSFMQEMAFTAASVASRSSAQRSEREPLSYTRSRLPGAAQTPANTPHFKPSGRNKIMLFRTPPVVQTNSRILWLPVQRVTLAKCHIGWRNLAYKTPESSPQSAVTGMG